MLDMDIHLVNGVCDWIGLDWDGLAGVFHRHVARIFLWGGLGERSELTRPTQLHAASKLRQGSVGAAPGIF